MLTLNDFKARASYVHADETARTTAVAANRRLYNNDFGPLGLKDDEIIKTNFFRRVATIFPDFLFGSGLEITTADNQRLESYLRNANSLMTNSLHFASIDSLRYGTGVISASPQDLTRLIVFEPDSWFIVDNDSEHADVLTSVYGGYTDRRIDIIVFDYVNATAELSTHSYSSITAQGRTVRPQVARSLHAESPQQGTIGERIAGIKRDIPPDARFAVPIYNGYANGQMGTSAFDDLRDPVRSMAVTAGKLSASIKKNLRPHLYGPANVLETLPNGSYDLHVDGMYFPLSDNDKNPGYLQWDSNVEAVKFERERNLQDIYTVSGMSPALFSDTLKGGALSGQALKRLLLPFFSKLERLRRSNEAAIHDLIAMLNAGRSAHGEEVFAYDPADVEIDWRYTEIFNDDSEETDATRVEAEETEE